MQNSTYPYELPPLPYDYEALEPVIDAETLHYHHDKHFQAYVNNLNLALKPYPKLQQLTLEQLLAKPGLWPREAYQDIQHNAGGVYNHAFYFNSLAPVTEEGHLPEGQLLAAIERSFGSFAAFQQKFSVEAQSLFGSGWTALSVNKRGVLKISNLPNQNTTVNQQEQTLLLFDVWEHAYYLQYRNLRADYVKQLWRIITFPNLG